MKRLVTKSEKGTLALGRKMAKRLKGGAVIGLVGDLGSGKTVFVKGLAKGLDIRQLITSPTFVLMKIYKSINIEIKKTPRNFAAGQARNQIKYLIHIDAYRVKEAQEIREIGAREYFGRPDTLVVIEWAEKIKKILPRGTIWLRFKVGKKENERVIYFS